LPGTFEDEKQFKKIVENFNFPKRLTTVIELHEPNHDEIETEIKAINKMVFRNKKNGDRTFFTLFYAGHGAMQNN